MVKKAKAKSAQKTREPKAAKRATSKPPKRYREFVDRFPGLGAAWETIHAAGEAGPLDPRTQRLVRVAVAMGAMREGAVRSGARKAIDQGIALDELEQLVPLAAATIGLPSAVACWSWISDALETNAKRAKGGK
ncbi:MAG TPA: carboxymuconolactone decarboxylase family protein [Thermoanaerobaculia bacterium]|nr:carboxymuconolactone decarboxylase family protein [Thermoanaerobaculia bacterium]